MPRLSYVGVLAAAALFATVPAASHGQSAGGTLTGTVGPGHAISLRTSKGAIVRTLEPGSYTIVVRDRAAIHNFHLFGAGVNKQTGIAFKGNVTWKATFRKGKVYTFRCDPHRLTLKRTFSVGAPPPGSPVPPPPPSPPEPPYP